MKQIKGICLFLVLSVMLSCQTTKPGTETSSLITTEHLVPQDVAVTGSSVSSAIDCDSLHRWLDRIKSNGRDSVFSSSHDTIRIPDKSGKLVMKFYLDKLGNIISECEQKDKTVSALVKQLEIEKSNTKVEYKIEKRVPAWFYMVLGASALLNVVLAAYAIYKYFFTIL